MRNAERVLLGKPERKRLCEEEGLDGRILLKWILKQIG
jgi:hypothetical protein